jgi:hypothetical protein
LRFGFCDLEIQVKSGSLFCPQNGWLQRLMIWAFGDTEDNIKFLYYACYFFIYLNIAMYKDNAKEKMNAILRILEAQYPLPVSESEITQELNISAEKVKSFLRFLAK